MNSISKYDLHFCIITVPSLTMWVSGKMYNVEHEQRLFTVTRSLANPSHSVSDAEPV